MSRLTVHVEFPQVILRRPDSAAVKLLDDKFTFEIGVVLLSIAVKRLKQELVIVQPKVVPTGKRSVEAPV